MSEIPPPTVPPSPTPSDSYSGGSYTPPPPGGHMNPPPPAGGPGGVSSNRTVMLILAYLGILSLVPLLMEKDDREVQWHAKNGLAMFLGWVAIWVVFWIIGAILPSLVGCMLALVQMVIGIGYMIVIIVAIMKALNGGRFRLPVISDFADKM